MVLLSEVKGRRYDVVTIREPRDLVVPFDRLLFPCLIWDHNGSFEEHARAAVAAALLDAGCRYAVCGGQQCDDWEFSVDREFVDRHIDEPDAVREAVHVMTTSHRGEDPDRVAYFFVWLTNFDEHDFSRFLVVHVGTGDAVGAVEDAVRRQATRFATG